MREIQKYRYITAAILTFTVFALGMLFSNYMDDRRYQGLENQVRQDNVQIESQQLQLNYLQSSEVNSCGALQAGLEDIIKGYNSRLAKVQQYQENSLFKEKQFKTTKRKYIISGIRYWMYTEQLKDKCGYNASTTLFFTENMFGDSDCQNCKSQGHELTLLKRKYDGELLVFTIPTDLDDGIVNMIEQQYNITETPSLVINAEQKLEGFQTRNEIQNKLKVTTN